VPQLTLLAFSDVHGSLEPLKTLVRDVEIKKLNFDAVVIAGDLGNPAEPENLQNILNELESLGKKVYIVRGNWDIGSDFSEDSGFLVDLDSKGPVKLGDYWLVGHGLNFTPYPEVDGNVILVTHYPPFGILDKGFKGVGGKGAHTGLVEINYLIEKYKPLVHIFGHAHTYGGIDYLLNDVLYVNVARLDRLTRSGALVGNYALITLEGRSATVKWIYFNGLWRTCPKCGRRVFLPVHWRICRKCISKEELVSEKLTGMSREYTLKVSIKKGNHNIHFLRNLNINVPITTMRSRSVLKDFVKTLLIKQLDSALTSRHDQVLRLSTRDVLEVYGGRKDEVTEFSSLDDLLLGGYVLVKDPLRSLMKTLSKGADYAVVWGLDYINPQGSILRRTEYIVVDEEDYEKNKEDFNALTAQGFTLVLVCAREGGSAATAESSGAQYGNPRLRQNQFPIRGTNNDG